MFGDDEKLLLPIVYDIANLVQNSTRKNFKKHYDRKTNNNHNYNYKNNNNVNEERYENRELQHKSLLRRDFLLSSDEYFNDGELNQAQFPSNLASFAFNTSSLEELEDFFDTSDKKELFLDPQDINYELEKLKIYPRNTKEKKTLHKTLSTASKVTINDDDGLLNKSSMDDSSFNNDDMIQPLNINYELYTNMEEAAARTGSLVPQKYHQRRYLQKRRRKRRSISEVGAPELVHKLIRSKATPDANEMADEFHNAAVFGRNSFGRNLQLNTSLFASAKDQRPKENNNKLTVKSNKLNENKINDNSQHFDPYEIVEQFVLNSLNDELNNIPQIQQNNLQNNNNHNNNNNNTLELIKTINIIDDLNTEASENFKFSNGTESEEEEPLPLPEGLVARPGRHRISKPNFVRLKLSASKQKRAPLPAPSRNKIKKLPNTNGVIPPPPSCERFTASMCIRTEDYPM